MAESKELAGCYKWLIAVCGHVIQFLSSGSMDSMGIFFVSFMEYFQTTAATTAWVNSLAFAVFYLIGPVFSILNDTFGTRRVIIFGGLLAGAGLVISTFATNIATLYFTYGIMTGTGFGLAFVPSVIIIGHYFHEHHAIANSIAFSGQSVAIIALGPIYQTLIDKYGWRGALLIVGGMNMNIIVCGALMKPSTKKLGTKTASEEHGKQTDVMEIRMVDVGTCTGNYSYDSSDINVTDGEDEQRERSKVIQNDFDGLDKQRERSRVVQIAFDGLDDEQSERSRVVQNDFDGLEDEQTERSGVVQNDFDRPDEISTEADTSYTRRQSTFSIDTVYNSKRAKDVCVHFAKLKLLCRQPSFVVVCISLLFCGFSYHLAIVHMVAKAVSTGIPKIQASFLMTCIGIGSLIGRSTHGFVIDLAHIPPVPAYIFHLYLAGIMLTLTMVAKSFAVFGVMVGFFGYAIGVYWPLAFVCLKHSLGDELLSPALGWICFTVGVTGLFSPPIGGWIFDVTANYNFSMLAGGLCYFLAGSIVLIQYLVNKCLHR